MLNWTLVYTFANLDAKCTMQVTERILYTNHFFTRSDAGHFTIIPELVLFNGRDVLDSIFPSSFSFYCLKTRVFAHIFPATHL